MRTRYSVGGRFSAMSHQLRSSPSTPQLVPVLGTAEQEGAGTKLSAAAETIEIEVGGKYRLRLNGDFNALALRRVVDAVDADPGALRRVRLAGGRNGYVERH
jgi:hypothetical protein